MQWLVSWYRRFQRLWLIVKRWLLGVLPLFAHAASKRKAANAKRAHDRSTPVRSYLDHFVHSETVPGHPVVDKLARKATNELFDWLGLTMIPNQTWAILERVGDPGATLEQLIRALGCDPLLARRRDPKEIARLELAIDVLVSLDSLRPYLSADHLSEIEYLLFDGDYGAVRTYSHTVKALSAVLIGREKAAVLRRFAAYDSFVQVVERYIADPWSLSPADAEEAQQLSDHFITAMERYTDLHAAVSETIAAIQHLWPGSGPSAPNSDHFDGILLRFEDIDENLVNDADVTLDQIDDLLRQCEEVIEDLSKLLEDLEPDADTSGGPFAAGLDEVDKALAFFGFVSGESPSPDEIKKAYKRKMKEVHPDLAPGTDPEEKARREEMAKEANLRYDLLRRRYTGRDGEFTP